MKKYLLEVCLISTISLFISGCSGGCITTSFNHNFALNLPRIPTAANLRQGVEDSIENEVSNQRSDLFNSLGSAPRNNNLTNTGGTGTSSLSLGSNNTQPSNSMFSSGAGRGSNMTQPSNNAQPGGSLFSPGFGNSTQGGGAGWSLY